MPILMAVFVINRNRQCSVAHNKQTENNFVSTQKDSETTSEISIMSKAVTDNVSDNIAPQDLVDHKRYPIGDIKNPLRGDVINEVKESLERDGCALLEGFLSSRGLAAILDEAMERRSLAYFSDENLTNAYFSDPDPSLPESHPVNLLMERSNGFITSDHFEAESVCRRLYLWEPLGRFLAECLGKPKLHIYADPVSNMIVNVCTPGTQFNWHFSSLRVK